MEKESIKASLTEQGFHHEIERKFVIFTPPDNISDFVHFTITQSYLGKGIRIRKINDDKYFLTEKIGTGLDRPEKEISITREQYDEKFLQVTGGTIVKERYIIENNGREIDLDIYKENLTGLIVAEVEFENIKQSKLYRPPNWFGREVTGRKDYSNENLAKTQKIPKISGILSRILISFGNVFKHNP